MSELAPLFVDLEPPRGGLVRLRRRLFEPRAALLLVPGAALCAAGAVALFLWVGKAPRPDVEALFSPPQLSVTVDGTIVQVVESAPVGGARMIWVPSPGG